MVCGRVRMLDSALPAAWPAWLSAAIWPPTPAATLVVRASPPAEPDAAVDGLIRAVRNATEGGRNAKLNWAVFHVREFIRLGAISENEARLALLNAARAAGLPTREAIAILTSALATSS